MSQSEEPKARPSHRLLMWHSDNKHDVTEVGALWPLKSGKPGFTIAIKRGLALLAHKDVRVVALEVSEADALVK